VIAIESFIREHSGDFAIHVAVSTAVLLTALAAARWIAPLTARTRHAILAAAMAALLVPPAIFARLFERAEPVRRLAGTIPHFGAAASAPSPASGIQWIHIAAALWLSITLILIVRWLIVSRRLLASALRIATPPPARAVVALDAARRRLMLRRGVDMITSPLCEAPAVVRVLRPVIVLPAHGCDDLDDEELESLLCHECAHVARRDNLLDVFEALLGAAFWFNPAVWLVRRQLSVLREAACDELVADTAAHAETYAAALAKFCRSLVAVRIPAVSCMASAHLKERMQHIMRYDSLRNGALSHRAIAATALIAVGLSLAGAGVLTATPDLDVSARRYLLNYSLSKNDDGSLVVRTQIVDTKNNEVMGEPTIMTKPGVPASTEILREGLRLRIDVTPGRIELVAYDHDQVVQRTSYRLDEPQKSERTKAYSGDKISLNLKDADIHDVLRTFGSLTGLEITTDPDVKASITMQFTETPWDEALDRIISEHGLVSKLDGNHMRVSVKH
jgi:beta-lactamase regulating signal transducer with metallopeptidase domain